MNYVGHGVYRGARPTGMMELKNVGVKTILSLQTGWFEWFHHRLYEEDKLAREAGIDLIHFPLPDLRAPNVQEIKTCLAIIRNACNNGRVYVHCLHGVDRTGFVCAAWGIVEQGESFACALKEWDRFGFHRRFYFWWPSKLRKMLPELFAHRVALALAPGRETLSKDGKK
jgi:hypothetical protein